MDVEITNGLATGLVTVDEALHLRSRPDVDVLRVIDPPASSWPLLRAAGYAIHPSWITWLAPACASEDAFLARLTGKERRSVRAGQRFVESEGISLKVVTPLDAQSFDAFLSLYEPQIASMRHGVPYAAMERDEILDSADSYFMVLASSDSLVGACVCRLRPDISTVVLRFCSTAPSSRQQRLVRAMYMQVFQTAREMGFRDISLGSDPALYGHMAKPGLFTFKSALSFTPVPSRSLGTMDDPDEATLVLRLSALTDPSLLVSYAPDSSLRADVFSSGVVDPRAYSAPFLSDVAVVHPEGAMLKI
ncbi:hypothetical protein Lesp02_60490 [Lentzea sp. NBRC 105346]|uniref:GNAT family N-acetyltransferase n=1 Tax=Lentzea sp. NBRC 105346 TaxID=3032205 RepID=UPI0025538C02|nr:GNAT family N-acetyltransferase [Lentzea sp. NBRC 105346]GLZ33861.1 hypothetical protein Lesp02_60490 [Lentzea sp. NBRC 105346]